MSNAKLGLLVFWPTFWTGFPLKMVIALLLLAGHVHPWEGIGLEALLVLSIPIDIWALGLCARTVFLERLSVDPPKGSALRMWAQWAVFSVIYLPIMSMVVGGVKALAKSATEGTIHFFEETFMVIPVAEKITIELVMWSAPTTIVLIILIYGWLFGLGALAQRHVRASTPVSGSFQDIVYKWDLLRIPNDQPLTLVAFTGVGLVLVFLFWGLIPVSTPHPHEEYQFINVKTVEERIVPNAVFKNAEQVLLQAEATIKELEKDNPEGKKSEADKESSGKAESDSSAK
jgi:hypothetical protein